MVPVIKNSYTHGHTYSTEAIWGLISCPRTLQLSSGRVRHQNTDLLIGRWPTLPPELQPSYVPSSTGLVVFKVQGPLPLANCNQVKLSPGCWTHSQTLVCGLQNYLTCYRGLELHEEPNCGSDYLVSNMIKFDMQLQYHISFYISNT